MIIDPLEVELMRIGKPKYADFEGRMNILDFDYYVKILKLQIKYFAKEFLM